jgi:hypothetical protein
MTANQQNVVKGKEMPGRAKRPIIFAVVPAFIAAAALTQGASAAYAEGTPSTPTLPNMQICNPSASYTNTTISLVDLGDPHTDAWTWGHNRGSSQVTLTLSFSTNSQVTYSLSSTQSVEAGVIFAKVAASVTEGISYSHTDTETKSLSVQVPAHDYGWLGADNLYARAFGNYKGVLGNCQVISYQHLEAQFPTQSAAGFEATTSTALYSQPPWPMAPA